MATFISGNIHVRPMEFDLAGETREGHEHNFDHTTYVVRGALRIEKLSPTGDVLLTVQKRATDRYNWVLVKAGVCHRITALEDNSLGHCIYAHRTPDGDVVQEHTGWAPAYD